MEIEKILSKLKKHDGNAFLQRTRNAAIMIPLIIDQGRMHILFEKRSAFVNHPSDTSFPGGHVEEGEDFLEAAIRETCEELLISRENIEIIGKFGKIFTFSNLYAEIFICQIVGTSCNQIVPDPSEVEEIFCLDLETLLYVKPDTFRDKIITQRTDNFPYHLIKEGRKYNFVTGENETNFYKVNGRVIWGFTARILKEFLRVVKDE